jgi:hypothetical protein
MHGTTPVNANSSRECPVVVAARSGLLVGVFTPKGSRVPHALFSYPGIKPPLSFGMGMPGYPVIPCDPQLLDSGVVVLSLLLATVVQDK